jgi:hypothetical protein
MAIDEKYYQDLKLKLQQREQRNIQKYLQAAFDYVEEQQLIKEQWNELLEREAEAKKIKEEKEKK